MKTFFTTMKTDFRKLFLLQWKLVLIKNCFYYNKNCLFYIENCFYYSENFLKNELYIRQVLSVLKVVSKFSVDFWF